MYLMKALYTWDWFVRIWLTYCSMQVKLTSATPTFTECAVTPTPSVVEELPELALAATGLLNEASIKAPANMTIIPTRGQRRTERNRTTRRRRPHGGGCRVAADEDHPAMALG